MDKKRLFHHLSKLNFTIMTITFTSVLKHYWIASCLIQVMIWKLQSYQPGGKTIHPQTWMKACKQKLLKWI